jgi:hypothetical protein
VDRIWIPTLAVVACTVIGVELDHVPASERRQAALARCADERVEGCATGPAASHGPADVAVCTWRPAGDDQPMGPAMVGTVRDVGGVTEVLHLVSCTDGWTTWVWMPDPRDTPTVPTVHRPAVSVARAGP